MTVKKVLMVAFHFPPQAGSSGILRTLNFVKNLPSNGWTPVVLTANPRAYEERRDDLLNSVPAEVKIIRAFALDAMQHLGIKRKYPRLLALPDRWAAWWFGGLFSGLRAIRQEKPVAIWSTYPITTAHLIGATLAKLGKLPWLADFRDPMINADYPSDPLQRKSWQWLEKLVMRTATLCVFTTERAAQVYRERYPDASSKCRVIENGYDEAPFTGARPMRNGVSDDQILLLHSGIIYPRDRDPSAFFQGVSAALQQGVLDRKKLCIRFRAPHHAEDVVAMAASCGLADVVDVAPPIPYKEAIAEMLGADLLLVFQGRHFNSQIPAKIYEYIRAGKPVMGLLDHSGDTATKLKEFNAVWFANIDDNEEISGALENWYLSYRSAETQDALRKNQEIVVKYSRASQTRELASLLNSIS